MNLFERLQKALDNGYMPVGIKSEYSFFFVENDRKFKIGDIVIDPLGKEYKVTHVFNNQIMVD